MSEDHDCPSNKFDELLAGFIDDSLTHKQSQQVAEYIQIDPEARARYRHCRLHANLAWEHGVLGETGLMDEFEREGQKASLSSTSKDGRKWARLFAIAASLMLLSGVLWTSVVPTIRKSVWTQSEAIGTVSRKSGGQLSVHHLGIQLHQGDTLRVGEYTLTEGLAQFVFKNKVEILVEAPARFNIQSPSLFLLSKGRLSAYVPPEGIGFNLETPNAQIVDYGTEFGVEVGSAKQSEVHVFKGEVEVKTRDSANEPVRLFGDQATRVDTNAGEPMGINLAPERFLRTFDEPVGLYSRAIRDLNPIVYYRMSISDDGITLIDKSGNDHHGRIERGRIKNPIFAPGRIGASLRLEGPEGQAYALVSDYPKAMANQISVVAWVYANSRPRWASIAKNWSLDEIGQFHFGLFQDPGGLEVQIRGASGETVRVIDPKALPIGRWQHVAFVADGRYLRLYRNGEEVGHAPYTTLAKPTYPSLGIGAKLLGQEVSTEKNTTGFWDGQIDELAIFNDALTADTIHTLYQMVSLTEIHAIQ